MLELYINDSIVDISGDVNITAAYAVLNLESISSRAGLRTVNVGLPKTNRNKTVFENSEIVNNLTTIPYQRLKARALVNGVDTLVRFAELEIFSNLSVVSNFKLPLFSLPSSSRLLNCVPRPRFSKSSVPSARIPAEDESPSSS